MVLGLPQDDALARAARDLALPEDRALARALLAQALRWLVDLDRLIDGAVDRPPPLDSRVRQVLRIALAGRLRLETPMHAVVATSLALLEGGPRRLAHAVLSRLEREKAALPPVPTIPAPWAGRWRARWGEEAVARMAAALGEVPATDLRLKDMALTNDWARRLGGQSLAPGHVRLGGAPAIESLPGFAEGAWWVQDRAAQIPVEMLGEVKGCRLLDLCAAPGGKTMQLAAAGAIVTALDHHGRRLERLRANLARTGLEASLVKADALTWDGEGAPFDAILLDAPCSATGTFRRHPEVLYRRAPGDLAGLARQQRALVARAAAWLRPGGRLVYAVCSVEPEEGEEVVRASGEFGLACEDMVTLLPGVGPGDGFFIARFRRT
jgi:16S rRNA (cytosine967-C5)-methyltransferase